MSDLTELDTLLESRGADPALRREVAAWIQTFGKTGTSPFQITDVVGHGAMGDVHQAVDHALQRIVAYKQINERLAVRPEAVARFLREAQVTAQLEHPNIVPVYALASVADNRPGYAMKLVRGTTLKDLIQEAHEATIAGRPVPDASSQQALLDAFLKVCDAIAYANNRGVVHRDIKPENIMVGAYNEVYVMDWGLAKLIDDPETLVGNVADINVSGSASSSVHTRFGRALGTPAYMSPEQAAANHDQVDGRSDQFALGLVLFEILTLRRAIEGDADVAMFRAQNRELNPFAHVRGLPLDPAYAAIFEKATALSPRDRYPDAAALADDIRHVLRDQPPSVRPDGVGGRILRWIGQNRAKVAAGFMAMGLVLLTTLLILLSGLVLQRRAAHQRTVAVGTLVQEVADQASRADAELLRLQGLLQGLGDSAVALMDQPTTTPRAIYTDRDFANLTTAPPDLKSWRAWGRLVSFQEPVFRLSPGVTVDAVKPQMERLSHVGPMLRRAVLQSHDPATLTLNPGLQESLLGQDGVPLVGAFVAVEDGIHVSWPGHTGYPEDYDARTRPWYRYATEGPGPRWAPPHDDVNGQGMLLTAVMALYDDQQTFRGVAAVELPAEHVVRKLLSRPRGAGSAWLIDKEGTVIVNAAQDADADAISPVLLDAIRSSRTGVLESGGRITVFNRMNSNGWTLVVSGEASELLSR